MAPYPASVAQFSKNGTPYEPGDILKQPDLARTLERIADQGPAGFYEGETAALIEKDMAAHGGLITRADLKAYQPKKRTPVTGTYRGYDIIVDAADQLGRRRPDRAAEHPRGLRPEGAGLPVGGEHARDDRGDAARRSPTARATWATRTSCRTCRSRG